MSKRSNKPGTARDGQLGNSGPKKGQAGQQGTTGSGTSKPPAGGSSVKPSKK